MLILVPVRYRVHQTDRDGDLPLLGYVELDRFDDSWIAEQGDLGGLAALSSSPKKKLESG